MFKTFRNLPFLLFYIFITMLTGCPGSGDKDTATCVDFTTSLFSEDFAPSLNFGDEDEALAVIVSPSDTTQWPGSVATPIHPTLGFIGTRNVAGGLLVSCTGIEIEDQLGGVGNSCLYEMADFCFTDASFSGLSSGHIGIFGISGVNVVGTKITEGEYEVIVNTDGDSAEMIFHDSQSAAGWPIN